MGYRNIAERATRRRMTDQVQDYYLCVLKSQTDYNKRLNKCQQQVEYF